MRSRTVWICLVIGGMLVAACGGSAEEGTTTTSIIDTTTTTVAPTSTTSPPTPTTTIAVTTTTADAPTTTAGSGGLPGEPIEFGPAAGDMLAVIGVAHDDVLNLRAAPGADQPILDGIPPLHDALIALGETRELPGSFWIGVDFEGTEGWVNLRYVGYLGVTNDTTHIATEEEVPAADTMLDLGFIMAEAVASVDPPSEIVLVVAPTASDLGEVTYDVIGLGDDALRGLRVHVFGEPLNGGFILDTVEETALCGRGADPEGACV